MTDGEQITLYVDDAIEAILEFSTLPNQASDRNCIGYDISLRSVVAWYLTNRDPMFYDRTLQEPKILELSPTFLDAAWALCRRGILRPSGSSFSAHLSSIDTGTFYSFTQAGTQWLQEHAALPCFPTDPSRFGVFVNKFRDKFGEGFTQRASESIKCYSSGLYLGCCVLAGAATESVLLKIAIAKSNGDEDEVLGIYKSASGRRRIEQRITGQLDKHLRESFSDLTGLLKFWRDEAGHGEASDISDNEAYIGLSKLLRFAHFVEHHWDILTKGQ
jgi:hypothetical protein